MDELVEYHKLVYLADNITMPGPKRPFHMVNTVKGRIGKLKSLFMQLDDDSLSILPNAQLVGAGVSRDNDSLVIVI